MSKAQKAAFLAKRKEDRKEDKKKKKMEKKEEQKKKLQDKIAEIKKLNKVNPHL